MIRGFYAGLLGLALMVNSGCSSAPTTAPESGPVKDKLQAPPAPPPIPPAPKKM